MKTPFSEAIPGRSSWAPAVVDWGTLPYEEAWHRQDDLLVRCHKGEAGDTVVLTEHPPVMTAGWRDCGEDILTSPEMIAADGIALVKTNRGGRMTYHGPGQRVVYFICNIDRLGVGIKVFVNAIESVCIRTLALFGVAGTRDEKHPGIWVGKKKIAAIGLHVERGVTEHGMALNVACDLAPYRHIVACGIRDRGVTSIALETGHTPAMADVDEVLRRELSVMF